MTQLLSAFIDKVMQHGIEYAFRRYPGVYPAQVTDNKDPDKKGRIQAIVPEVNRSDKAPGVWIKPAWRAAKGRGEFWPPEVGDWVGVTFEYGDKDKPQFYFGGWFGDDELPSRLGYGDSGLPEKRGFVTRIGHTLVFNDGPGSERIQLMWHKPAPGDPALTDRTKTADSQTGKFSALSMDPDGSIMLITPSGFIISLDETNKQVMLTWNDSASGKSHFITMDSDGITLLTADGAHISISKGDVIVTSVSGNVNVTGQAVNLNGGGIFLGQGAQAGLGAVIGPLLAQILNQHVHPTTAPGAPTGFPTPPFVAATFSSKRVVVGP